MKKPRELDILQVTINNRCNLACPHCYLNMSGSGYLEDKTVEAIFSPENLPEKVAIVGMEPLYDAPSARLVRHIARRGHETSTFVSMITNGLGFKHLLEAPDREMPRLIDVSLDGGPRYYARFRGNGKDLFPKIVAGAQAIRSAHPSIPLNILHTLFVENSTPEIVEDMVESGRLVSPEGGIYFSPFISPAIQIGQRTPTANVKDLDGMLRVLAGTAAFMDHPATYFFMGPYNADSFGLSMGELSALIESHGLTAKSRLDTGIPHLNGGLRVMFNGYAIRPDYSIHTYLTQKYGVSVEDRTLPEIYESFKALPSVREVLAL